MVVVFFGCGRRRVAPQRHFFIAAEDTSRCPPAWQGRVAMIDLHRLCRNPGTPLFPHAKDLGQLLYSSDLPGVSDRDRVYFWRQYLGYANLGWLHHRLLRWMIRSKAWVYHRNHRRKQRQCAKTT